MANFSIIGAYNFMPSIFDCLKLPEALDRSTAINNILMECAELELLYSDLDFLSLQLSNGALNSFSFGKNYMTQLSLNMTRLKTLIAKRNTPTRILSPALKMLQKQHRVVAVTNQTLIAQALLIAHKIMRSVSLLMIVIAISRKGKTFFREMRNVQHPTP